MEIIKSSSIKCTLEGTAPDGSKYRDVTFRVSIDPDVTKIYISDSNNKDTIAANVKTADFKDLLNALLGLL